MGCNNAKYEANEEAAGNNGGAVPQAQAANNGPAKSNVVTPPPPSPAAQRSMSHIEDLSALQDAGVWKVSMDGDSESTRPWKEIPGAAGAQLDKGLAAFAESPHQNKRLQIENLIDGDKGTVDFEYLTTMYQCDKQSRARVLPLARFSKDTGNSTHPAEGAKHPWYIKRVAQKEANTQVIKGGEWLTNEYFFKAFSQAVRQGGGVVDFEPDEMFDFRFNEDLRGKDPTEVPMQRRGGILYREPCGWKRFAINCKGKYDNGDNTWMGMSGKDGEWGVAYHGTAMNIVPLIIKNGFKVGTGQGAKNADDTRTGTKVGSGVFCTPNLTTVECYANGAEDGGSEQKTAASKLDGHTLFFAFQCRIRPGAIRRPDRHFARNNDEECMGVDGVFEWIINSPQDIRPYGVLVRDKENCDHRTLGSLIAGGNWMKEHKPLKFGHFDNIPGRASGDLEGYKRSHAHAVANIK